MFRALFLCLLALSAAAQAPVPSVISPDDRALYGVINRASGRSLDIAKASTLSGTAAVQWEFTHAASQQWRLVRISEGSEYYRLEDKNSQQCLTLENNPSNPPGANTPLIQRPYTGGLGQQWRLVPTGQPGAFQLENRLDGRVATLESNNKFNGTAVVAARALGRGTQQWRLFQLQLRLFAGPPYFAAPEPLVALGAAGGSELQPVPAPDGTALYFNRTRFAGNTEGVAETGDIWVSRSADQGRTWPAPTRLEAPAGLNNNQNNAVQSVVGPAGSPVLLLRDAYNPTGNFAGLGAARLAAGGTGTPAPVRIANFASSSPATGFFMTPDEKILLLSLEREDSQGLNDLYLSRADGAGGYTAPQSLGLDINSPGYEFAPWLAPDGKTLYFSSYGHQGYGSSDIFVSTRLDESWTRWSPPQNLGPRFNGPGYDGFFALGPDGVAYFASSGAKDTAPKKLFRTPPGPPPAPDSAAVAAAANPLAQPRALVTGRVLNATTGQPLAGGAEVQALLIGGSIDFRATAKADALGFQMSLAPGRYRVTTTAGLLTRVDTLAVGPGESRRYDPRLTPATAGTRLDLPDIIFAQSQARLLGSSYATLNKLAESLKENPGLEIRLEGHTDNQGEAALNQKLSEDRVAEVKRYLVRRGVADNRISTVGFGGSKPKFDNNREETRRLNRRVELVITK